MKADIAVVGGGPAGAATAILLARRGFEVALFDRASFPRDKACGEFLNPGAVRLLLELGVEMPVDAEPVDSVCLVPEKGLVLSVKLAWPPSPCPLPPPTGSSVRGSRQAGGEGSCVPRTLGYSLRRIRTDTLLIEAARRAGVRVYEGATVQSAFDGKVEGDGFESPARLVVAADGTHSGLARQRALTVAIPRLQRIGLTAHFDQVEEEGERGIRMFAARRNVPGVAGYARQSGGRAVLSAVLPKSVARELSQDREGFVRKLADVLGLPEGRLEDVRTTTCFGHRLRRIWDEGMLFVGDAARFVDPFTGEGLHHALQGAVAAAETAADYLHFGRSPWWISVRTPSSVGVSRHSTSIPLAGPAKCRNKIRRSSTRTSCSARHLQFHFTGPKARTQCMKTTREFARALSTRTD